MRVRLGSHLEPPRVERVLEAGIAQRSERVDHRALSRLAQLGAPAPLRERLLEAAARKRAHEQRGLAALASVLGVRSYSQEEVAAALNVSEADIEKQRAEAELAALRATLEDEKSRGSTTPTTADAEKAPTAKASLDPSDAVVRNLMPAFDASISRGLKTMTLNIVNFTDNAGDQAALQSKYHLFSEELTKARPGVVFVQEVQSGDGSETDGGKKAMRKLTELINKKLGSDDRYKFVVSLKAGGKERYGVMWDTTILGKGGHRQGGLRVDVEMPREVRHHQGRWRQLCR